MIIITRLSKNYRGVLSLPIILLISLQSFAQKQADWELEKIPADLETDFALSALPPHLRNEATV